MHRARIRARRCLPVAGSVVALWLASLPGCATSLDGLRNEWASHVRAKPPICQDVSDCKRWLERVERARREACGAQATTCERTDSLEREMRAAILKRFEDPCRAGALDACIDAHEFGLDEGLRTACELGSPRGCELACEDTAGADARERGKVCAGIAERREQLLKKCSYGRQDDASACRELGVLIRWMASAAPASVPDGDLPEPPLYQTPMLDKRIRMRYARDYFSRACHLGDAAGCKAVCDEWPDDTNAESRSACRDIVKTDTARTLEEACRNKQGEACFKLGQLRARMGFYDRDPAGFFVSGPGRVVGLNARACRFGYKEACAFGGEL